MNAKKFLKKIDGRIMQREKEIDFLISVLNKIKPKSVLEIGTCGGGVTTLLAEYADSVVTIDIERSSQYVYDDFKNLKSKVKQIIGNSNHKKTLAKVKGNYDLVVIDGGHDWKTGHKDWDNYSSLAPVIMIHDIHQYEFKYRTADCGTHWDWFPTEFWHYIKTKDTDRNITVDFEYNTDEIVDIESGGWGVIYKK